MKKKFYIIRKSSIWFLIFAFLVTTFSYGLNKNYCEEECYNTTVKTSCDTENEDGSSHSCCSSRFEEKTVSKSVSLTKNKVCDISCIHSIDNFNTITYLLPKSIDLKLNYFHLVFVHSNNEENDFVMNNFEKKSLVPNKSPIYISVSSLLI